MHTSLDGVPALVLNCNADLNLEADPAARRDLAQRVSAYCAFVRSLKARRRCSAQLGFWTLFRVRALVLGASKTWMVLLVA